MLRSSSGQGDAAVTSDASLAKGNPGDSENEVNTKGARAPVCAKLKTSQFELNATKQKFNRLIEDLHVPTWIYVNMQDFWKISCQDILFRL